MHNLGKAAMHQVWVTVWKFKLYGYDPQGYKAAVSLFCGAALADYFVIKVQCLTAQLIA